MCCYWSSKLIINIIIRRFKADIYRSFFWSSNWFIWCYRCTLAGPLTVTVTTASLLSEVPSLTLYSNVSVPSKPLFGVYVTVPLVWSISLNVPCPGWVTIVAVRSSSIFSSFASRIISPAVSSDVVTDLSDAIGSYISRTRNNNCYNSIVTINSSIIDFVSEFISSFKVLVWSIIHHTSSLIYFP